ncbi:hypothetical protein R50073_20820 [Maricurvus nonylphenolicus]|uniref:DUF3658 domain-containing protein n=1 Tax=Maricurvus nonylphenolicus TaxID=1008307 RepID=UPI0036F2AB24
MVETPHDSELTEDQINLVSSLTDEQLQFIDQALLAEAGISFRKVAKVVSMAMIKLEGRIKGIPDVFYAQRVFGLVDQGKLVAQGNVKRMFSCEVKLP